MQHIVETTYSADTKCLENCINKHQTLEQYSLCIYIY